LLSHAGCIAAGVRQSVQFRFVRVVKWKTAGAIDTKLDRPIVRGRTSASTDPEVKRSQVKVTLFSTVSIGSMALPAMEMNVDWTADD